MKKILGAILVLLTITTSLIADEKDIVKQSLLNKIDKVIFIIKSNKNNKELRNSKIVETLTPMFDFELMAKLSLGKKWKTLKKEDRKTFVKLYVERMKKSYSSKLDAYSDEKVEVTKTYHPKNKSNRIVVETNLINQNEKLQVDYKYYKLKKMKKGKEPWLIYDVEILGVSILKTDKAQFREFLKNKTIYELMESLKEK